MPVWFHLRTNVLIAHVPLVPTPPYSHPHMAKGGSKPENYLPTQWLKKKNLLQIIMWNSLLAFHSTHCFSTHKCCIRFLSSWSDSTQLPRSTPLSYFPQTGSAGLHHIFILAKSFWNLLTGTQPTLVFSSFQNHPKGREECSVSRKSGVHKCYHLPLLTWQYILLKNEWDSFTYRGELHQYVRANLHMNNLTSIDILQELVYK
jgi:hypothetical protein